MSYHIPQSDRNRLDHIIGKALCDDEYCQALLHKSSRSSVLEPFELSDRTYALLMSLENMAALGTMAQRIYRWYSNGGRAMD